MNKRYIISIFLVLSYLDIVIAQDHTLYLNDNASMTTEAGAILHVEGDFHMDTNADLDHTGTMVLQGDWYFESANVDLTASGNPDEQGLIRLMNNYVGNPHNSGTIQRIYAPADMMGNAAFYDLELKNDLGIIELAGGSIEIKNTLNLDGQNQILRTDDGVTTTDGSGDYAHFVRISNPAPTAIIGAANASGATNGYIQGRLQWNTTSGTTYSFPIGVDAKGMQTFDIRTAATSNTILEAAFTADAGGTISLNDCSTDIDCAIHHGWWNIDPIGSNNITSYAVTLKAANVVDDCAGADFTVIKKPDGTGIGSYALEGLDGWDAASSCDLVATTTASVSRHDMNTFSDFSIGATASEVLPVELLSFSGNAEDKWNRLFWETATEVNVSHFEIEKSRDALFFEHIVDVNARGNSNSVLSYDYFDKDLWPLAYYRLRIVDWDGHVEYSETIVLNREDEKNRLSVYPNPVQDELTIAGRISDDGPMQLVLLNAVGMELQNEVIRADASGYFTISMKMDTYPKGQYFIGLFNGNNWEYESLIKTE